MRGTHIGMRSVSAASVQHLALTFASSPLMEMDGEDSQSALEYCGADVCTSRAILSLPRRARSSELVPD